MHVSKTIRISTLLLTTTVVAASNGQINPRHLLQMNYDKISRLSMKRDKVNLERLIQRNAASNFEYIDEMKNSLDLAATVRQNTEQISRVTQFNSASNKIIGVKVQGQHFICTVKTTYDVFMDAEGKVRVTGTGVSKDTWVKTLKGWKIKQSESVNQSSYMNGKLLKRKVSL